MKKFFLLIIFAYTGFILNGQTSLRYHFENSLNEATGAGPALQILGIPGTYVLDTLNEISGKTKIVYRFERNNGFRFLNAATYLKKSYTIELYFVFDDLGSWKRVVDWKNRKVDAGAYVYNGQLNFYPYVYSGNAPVIAGEYTYYVVTRDSTTNLVKLYTDAKEEISFIDNNGDAVVDTSNVLNFFVDDLAVPGEASAGAVALLNLYNYVLDTITIKNNFNDLQGKVFGVNNLASGNEVLHVFPNPVNDKLNISLNLPASAVQGKISLFSSSGLEVCSVGLKSFRNQQIDIGSYQLPDGIYLLRVDSGQGIYSCKIVIRK